MCLMGVIMSVIMRKLYRISKKNGHWIVTVHIQHRCVSLNVGLEPMIVWSSLCQQAHGPGMLGTFPHDPARTFPHFGLVIPICSTACAWRIPGACATRNFTDIVRGPCGNACHPDDYYKNCGTYGVHALAAWRPFNHSPELECEHDTNTRDANFCQSGNVRLSIKLSSRK